MALQAEELRAWIGRSDTIRDTINPTPVIALTATLDHPSTPVETGTALPYLWHWLYFLPMHRQSEIGADGHAKRGGFLPPVPLPRRMWAGSQFEFRSPIRVGDRVARTSTIDDVTVKPVRELTQREIERDNPEFRLVEDTLHFLSHIYSREVALDDTVSVIHFSEVIEFPSLK